MWVWCPKLFLRDPSVTPETEHRLSSLLSPHGPHSKQGSQSIPISVLSYLFLVKTHLWPIQSAKVFVFIPIEHLLLRQAIPLTQSAT